MPATMRPAAEFQQAIADDPRDYGAHFNLALADSFLHRDEEGIAEYRKALELKPHLYEQRGQEAVRHLFRVAASLDSMVVGEPQILGQLKNAYAAAKNAGGEAAGKRGKGGKHSGRGGKHSGKGGGSGKRGGGSRKTGGGSRKSASGGSHAKRSRKAQPAAESAEERAARARFAREEASEAAAAKRLEREEAAGER